VTVRALAGLVALHAFYLAVGAGLLWAVGGWRRWTSAAALAGLAYLLGVAALGVLWTLLLAVGVPFGGTTILVTGAAVIGGGIAIGRGRRHRVERRRFELARLQASSLVTAAGVAVVGVYLEALFRSARLQGLFSFDGWAFWVPRGKAIYFFDGFDEQVFANVPNPSYPPVVPILDAAAFHAMGSADVVTLHVQYWLLALGFVACAGGLLARRVPPWILWPSLALAFVLPRMRSSVLAAQADLPLDYFVVAGAILVALWIVERRAWQLPSAALLLACAALVKREGLVLAACVVLAGMVATVGRRRDTWPRLALVGVAAVAAVVPWTIWYAAHGIGSDVGKSGDDGSLARRSLDSLRLAFDVLSDTSLWSAVPTVGLAAAVLALLWGRRAQAVYAVTLVLLLTLFGAGTTVVFRDLQVTADEALNPIVRLTAGTVLAISCLTPLLLAGAWGSGPAEDDS
jgi:hypothetical protein